jgi:hypothetical protein
MKGVRVSDGCGGGFCSRENHSPPSDSDERPRFILSCFGPNTAQAGARARLNSRPRPRLRPGRGGRAERACTAMGRGLPCYFGPKEQVQKRMSFFLFPANIYFWKMNKWFKRKIENVFFPCG